MTSPRYTIDDPIFWREFLKRLSLTDPEYDARLIASLCEATQNTPEYVVAKMKTFMHYADASTAAH
jgi:hypothetical protein